MSTAITTTKPMSSVVAMTLQRIKEESITVPPVDLQVYRAANHPRIKQMEVHDVRDALENIFTIV